jgi:preprotein translocase subunit SecG
MRLLLFVSVFGILVSIAVLIVVLIKAKKDAATPPKGKRASSDEE